MRVDAWRRGCGGLHVHVCPVCISSCSLRMFYLCTKQSSLKTNWYLYVQNTAALYTLLLLHPTRITHTHGTHTHIKNVSFLRPSLPCYKTPTNASLVGIDPATACCNVTQQYWCEKSNRSPGPAGASLTTVFLSVCLFLLARLSVYVSLIASSPI